MKNRMRSGTSRTIGAFRLLLLLSLAVGCSGKVSDRMLDNTFGTKGVVRNYISGGDHNWDQAFSVLIQTDGKMVAAGYSEGTSDRRGFALARYNSDGTLDNTFGQNGTVRNYVTGSAHIDDEAFSVAIQSDGKIVAAGYSEDVLKHNAFALVRYDRNGTLDSTFGTGGTVRNYISGGSNADDEAYSVLIQPNGKIVVVGFSENSSGNSSFALARYNVDGTLDKTFGTGGTVRNSIPYGIDDQGYSAAIQSDGKIIVVGSSGVGDSGSMFAVGRYTVSGNLDSSFGVNGMLRNHIYGGDEDAAYSVAVQPDGKIVAGGRSQGHSANYAIGYAFGLARYDTNGILDNTFGTNGTIRNYISGSDESQDEGSSLAIQPDGRIVLVGKSGDTTGSLAFALARYNLNGRLDSTFGTDGTIRNYIPVGKNQGASSVAIQSDGKIVVAGWSFGAFTIMRYNSEQH